MEVSDNASPYHRQSPIFVYLVILLTAFLMPIVAVPFGVGEIMADKRLVFTILALLALVGYLIARLSDGTFTLPRSRVLYAFGLVSFAYLLSAIFSTYPSASFAGSLFDSETFWLILFLFVILYLTSITFQNLSRVAVVLLSLFISALILFLIQMAHLVFGWTFGSALPFADSSLIGKWYDLGIFFGLTLLTALVFIEFAPRLIFFRRASIIIGLVSLLSLIFVNFSFVWYLIILFSLIVIGVKFLQRIFPRASIVLCAIAILAIFLGRPDAPLDRFVNHLSPAPIEVRPSWKGTYQVAKESLKENPMLGTGPNLFVREWVKHKPLDVNTGPFWSADFNVGVGQIPTALVTTGLIGFAAWLAFLLSLIRHVFVGIK